jgi:mannitol-1-phosphate 5-dehydrogenase
MKAVHFGAGNIGRGFIGLILSKAGFQVTFVDVNETLVSLLRERGQYEVVYAEENGRKIVVTNVRAIDGNHVDEVAAAVASADLVTTAVGVNILKFIAEPIAKGIERRLEAAVSTPLHVIACENAIGGSSLLKAQVRSRLSESSQSAIEGSVAFPNAAVDRIVPLQHHADPLQVTVEPFSEWVVDRSALLSGFPSSIEGIHLVDDLEPYIERKLFTVNTGHCCAAYHGFLRGFETIQQAMADPQVKREVEGVLQETGAMLVQKYGFPEEAHRRYRDTIVERFTNPHLTDEVVRVGRSPIRKLSPNDRLVRPATLALELGIPVPHLCLAMAAAFRFEVADDPESAELQAAIAADGLDAVISKYTSLPSTHPLHRHIADAYEKLSLAGAAGKE